MATVALDDDRLTTNQAARILELTPERVRQLAERGDLPSHRTALGRLFSRADVEDLRARRTAESAS